MKRRTFFSIGGALAAATLAPMARPASAQTPAGSRTAAWARPDAPHPWRTFEIVTEVQLPADSGPSKLWLPLPRSQDTPYQRALGVSWQSNAGAVELRNDPVYGAPMLYAQWDANAIGTHTLSVKTWAATRDRVVDLTRPTPDTLDMGTRSLYLAATPHLPTDGIVRATALKAVANAGTDPIAQARALYEWIVVNTYRNPKTVGCGTGDIRFMLESGDLGGKCADLNSLFVGMARSIGIPARDMYGVRVTNSANWKCLGKPGDITKAQHCRAEFHDARFGWIPVDPADVRKIILEEEPGRLLPLDDERVRLARETFFGAWEMNWIGFNTANDLVLSPPSAHPLNFFMYPRAETAAGPLDPYDPAEFRYSMRSRQLSA